MKKYIFLFEGGKASEDKETSGKNWMAWFGKIMQTGKVDSGSPFEKAGKRVSGEMKIEDYDGNAADALSGYLVVKADSLHEAAQLVDGCPLLSEGGTVEVRELQDMPM